MHQRKTIVGMAVLFAAILVSALAVDFAPPDSSQQPAEQLYQAALLKKEAEGDLNGAIKLFQDLIVKFPDKRDVAARAQLQIGACYEKLGTKEAEKAYQKVIANYPEQAEAVNAARQKLAFLSKVLKAGESGGREYQISRIPTDPEKASIAIISPDGKKLAIAGMDGEIWARDIAAAKDTRLTQTSAFEYWCFWSPDSEKIAYLDALNGLHVVSVDGGEPISLIKSDSDFIQSGKFAWPVGWTPDCKMIICQVPGRGLCAIPFDGGAWRDIFRFSSPDQEKEFAFFALSPDNTRIAYVSQKSGNGDIFIMPITGGESIRVTDHPASDNRPTWSFDGRRLAFFSGRSGENEIWVVKISPEGKPEGEPVQVTQGGAGRNCLFSWTKDGKIGISKTPIIMNIFVTDLGSGKETQLTRMLTNDQRPRWSPDGTQVAYISENAGKRDLWLVSPEGGEPRLVTGSFTGRAGVESIRAPSWLPDGKSLAFIVFMGVERQRGIWVIPAQGGEARKVNFIYEGSILSMDWSPDGKKIAFDYSGTKDDRTIKGSRIFESDIYAVPAEGGEPVRITKMEKPGLSFQVPRWSPDGKKIAFVGGDWFESNLEKSLWQIWVADLENGKTEQITKKDARVWQALGWAPDGRSLFYSVQEKNKDQLFRVPVEGGEPVKLNIEGTYPDCSPDGKKIAYSKMLKTVHEFWLIENFLPPEKR